MRILAGVRCSQRLGAYHVLVAEEEHEGHGIVELVHLLKVWNLI